ncbi:MAG: hypothetical protein EXR54_00565 [Dehalococcoidia bacterium]|nr:hypothetical protein [Dehalococcoidia bacterium]MSQ16053.1 hypothetical protein [Dehalococcoidia bacterium]
MEYVKIKLLDPEDEAKAFFHLVQLSKVVSLNEGGVEVFIVPGKSLAVLDQKELAFQVLGEMGYDGVLQALRSSLTP